MPSLPDTLRVTAARCPQREGLVFADRRRTYGELHAEVERTAAALAAAGVRPGDRVLLMAGNSDAFVITAYAVLRTGAILSPANPRNAAPELAHQIGDSGASAVIHAEEHAEVVRAAVEQAGTGPVVLSWPALVEAAESGAEPLDLVVGESDDALLLYTSGTTGAAKGALFDHHRAQWVAVSISGAAGYRDGDRTLHVAPLYHAAQLTLALFAGTALGMTHVVAPAFEPSTVADTLARERISVFFGVPTMYQFLLRLPDLAARDLSAWRVGMFGAAPMPAHTARELAATLPTVELYQLCGQTEGGPAASTPVPTRSRPARRPAAGTRCRTPRPASSPSTVPTSSRARSAS